MANTDFNNSKKNQFKKFWKGGDPFIWLAGFSLFSILFLAFSLFSVLVFNGLGIMWPKELKQFEMKDGKRFLALKLEEKRSFSGEKKIKAKIANKDINNFDFRWFWLKNISEFTTPIEAYVLERKEYGDFFGFLDNSDQSIEIENKLVFRDANGIKIEVDSDNIVRYYQPNKLSTFGKLSLYLEKLFDFLTEEPREANTEGGIFPAIYGTIVLIFLMSIFSFPLGVITAVYLKEYAKDGYLVRFIRISVNNLAGVPSIVYGVFGLSFFIYGLGGALDSIFFSGDLPTPTFGTGGILWASMTLGLLTVPVVIVTTEEALGSVPKGIKEASLALGATKLQTILKVTLPMASPGILTGFILAMARAAGEVAPLMLTGVVKLAPSLPLDGNFPFFHLERKFMHLGFHIYDVGFQSPNVEASKPMVYLTAFLLIAIVLVLSSLAIYFRARMKKKFTLKSF